MKYIVIYEKTPSNYSAYVPDLPGCVAAARSKREVTRLIREAVLLHIEALREGGDSVPEPTAWAELVEA